MFCPKCGQSVSPAKSTDKDRAEALERCLMLLRDKIEWNKNYAGMQELVDGWIKRYGVGLKEKQSVLP